MKTFPLKNATVRIRRDGILHIHIKAHAHLQLEDAREIVQAMRLAGHGKKYPVFIDAGEFISVDKEVRAFSAASENNLYTLADAIAYHSFAQKLLADFYVKQDKPVVPTKVFADKMEALKWLKPFVPGK